MPADLRLEKLEHAAGSTLFSWGAQLCNAGRVHFAHITDDTYQATVREGHREHLVTARFEENRAHYRCTCHSQKICIHFIAATIAAQKHLREGQSTHERDTQSWQRFYEKTSNVLDSQRKGAAEWQLIYNLAFMDDFFLLQPRKAYIKKNGELGRVQPVSQADLGWNTRHDPRDKIALAMLSGLEHLDGTSSYTPFQYHYHRYGTLPGELFDYLASPIYFQERLRQTLSDLYHFVDRNAHIEWHIEKEKERFLMYPALTVDGEPQPVDGNLHLLSSHPVYAADKNSIFKIDGIQDARPLAIFLEHPQPISIPEKEFPEFLAEALPALRQGMEVDLSETGCTFHKVGELAATNLHLAEIREGLQIIPWFIYGGFEVVADSPAGVQLAYHPEDQTITEISRDPTAEQAALEILKTSGLNHAGSGPCLVPAKKALPWLLEMGPNLAARNFFFSGLQELKNYRVRTSAPRVQIGIATEIDWFDVKLSFSFDGVVLQQKELIQALRRESPIVKLTDGTFARLPDEWMKKLHYLYNLGEMGDKSTRVARGHITLLDLLHDDSGNWQDDKEFRRLQKKLKSFTKIAEQDLPAGFTGTLRPYQKTGYDWLCFLQEFGFGGCLADDMGLGKTVQTLALLQRARERGSTAPSLVICPTSLVFNWQQEAAKFAPDLEIAIHTGLDRSRDQDHFYACDLILTTYGIMLRDIEFLKNIPFHYVILDESQKIKNPLSYSAKAAKLLQARHRLVLTGTPVENNTIELWSQFSFLNPGLLGNLHYFKRAFAIAIEKGKDESAARTLRKLIYPFILRRKKEEVAKDLPPRHEQIITCDMLPEQEKIYQQWRDHYRQKILAKIDSEGMDQARMNVLEGLVRLRQIACHPFLVDPTHHQDSGKFALLKETLEEILAENHKVLIFSQFVKMLDLMRRHLDREEWRYEYLDGQTRDRQSVVERFQQEDDIRLFLISLRAGGTGLNLTAADYVILYDPWWNPAVEMQASDRTHRIGQTKPVFIYRLITRATVEEKMLQLQERKKALVNQLIATDGSLFKQLTREDVAELFS